MKDKNVGSKECVKSRKKNLDVKEMMAILMIQHNLIALVDENAWGRFHKDIQKLVEKYWTTYKKGLNKWFNSKNEEMEFNI